MADEEKEQKPKPQSVASDIAALMSGLKTTLAETFRPVVTTMYPEEKTPRSERYRGRHYLRRYDNGLERCIGCELCASAGGPGPTGDTGGHAPTQMDAQEKK